MSAAIVTGAAGGLGGRIGERLAAAGHDLVLVDLDPAVEEVATAPGARAVVADLTAAAGVEAVLAAAGEEVGVLVNNAGITRDARATKMSGADFAAVIEINLVAAIRLTLALEERFVDGAAVVNMSSRASLGNFGQANYSASKAGLVGFGRALAQRWAPRVRVNAVAPSLVDTPMTQAMPPEVLAKLVARIPAGRIGTPDDVAGIVAFLASPDAAYISGQVIYACGGRSVAP
ncbi:MAG TPA: SDR family oxidoreductase [Solirubrobacterales bacterium]|jgi:NAD(P)-dependent dehydrogenase (short-subunit alcohol dehydrogenase family)|nr:SDR family oxidoreductase [Solirubrobacterales bacterium]